MFSYDPSHAISYDLTVSCLECVSKVWTCNWQTGPLSFHIDKENQHRAVRNHGLFSRLNLWEVEFD